VIQVQPAGGRAYPVIAGAGVLAHLPELIPPACPHVVLIADDQVARVHGDRARELLAARTRVSLVTFPAGEVHKTRATKEKLEDRLFAEQVGRDGLVVALGGGVTTDLAGFVAATYQRGVPWVAVPTTLLAAVDASVGGKVGVDTPWGKNLIGSIHHPLAVCIDVDLFQTLAGSEVHNGLAEMLKHAVIADPGYFDALLHAAHDLIQLTPAACLSAVVRSVEIKSEVVSADPLERDLRQVLNFGHTIGHAIELLSDFAISHGRAVAIGMSVEAAIACQLQLLSAADLSRLRTALRALGLPVSPPVAMVAGAILQATARDKKGRQGRPRYVLPRRIGEMSTGPAGYAREVSDAVVIAALHEAQACSA
jgi:3-dehydroquinate synthase